MTNLPAGVDPAIDLARHFSDPDGQSLTYTASSSATAIVSVAVTDSTLMLDTRAEGVAAISVTASDGHEDVDVTFNVTVTTTPTFTDKFASTASLNDWLISDSARAAIEDSRLVLTAVNSGFMGLATRDFEGEAEGITVDVALRPTAQGQAGF